MSEDGGGVGEKRWTAAYLEVKAGRERGEKMKERRENMPRDKQTWCLHTYIQRSEGKSPQELNVNEDCFSIGHQSLESWSNGSPRWKERGGRQQEGVWQAGKVV